MKRIPTRLLTALVALLFVGCTHAQDTRPNILVIMADDLGFADIGCFGAEIQTPNLDKLADNGLRFTQFYNTAKCHSSRVSLLTGLYSNQAGQESLSRGITTAQVLRNAGYFTAMTGKWHLKDQPTDHGFQRYWGHLSGACNFFTGDNTFRLNGEKWVVPRDEGFYTTTANADWAIKFIDEAKTKDKPMYLYMAFNAPHYPLHCLEEDYRVYEDTYKPGWDTIRKARQAKQKELGLFGNEYLTPAPRPDHVKPWDQLNVKDKYWESQRMAAYAAMVHRMDLEIGRVLDHLRKNDMFDNTFVLFVSDNGACPFDRTRGKQHRPWDPKSYWCYSPGWAHVGNTPFRLYKQNQHEGGISSPAIAHWPAGLKTEPGSITDQPAHLIDVMATVIELGNTSYPEKDHQGRLEPLQGKSLVPILNGESREPHDALYFNFSVNRAIRVGDMKLVSFRSSPWELYDLSTDRTELNNLAAEQPELVKSMGDSWHHWAEHVNLMTEKQRRPVKETMQKPNF
ncbi:MAG: arylsulfatase [Phycisphaeraceae bacterium]|nr:arylsulfatase [Phycisphaeraceae bacterium]